MNKGKSGKGKTITIIVLVILLIGALGYIAYDKLLVPKEEKVKTEPIKEEEEKENLDEVANMLVNKIKTYQLDELDIYSTASTFSSTPNQAQLNAMISYCYMLKKDDANYNSDDEFIVKKQDIDNYFKEVFGVIPTSYPDIQCPSKPGWNHYIYSNEKQGYIPDGMAHSDVPIQALSSIVKNITKENDVYTLDLVKIFDVDVEIIVDSVGPNESYQAKELKEFEQFAYETEAGWDENAVIKYFQDNKEYYLNNNPVYRYTFKKEDNNFYLIKHEFIA